VLLDIEEAEGRPFAGALEVGPDVGAEVQYTIPPSSAVTAYRTTMALA
jgi:hypothetical protein